ncbi:hypothetical protein [Stenotrophomonas sp. NLF4-10]|uniref:hypothetical protein n=1 Tax=Stenotrophomonas sp. NLF4-10 TaxID=2918754 RepID=UPI001EFA9CB5|nr:hypothetical protein [Stenotrophomonas sp. NLF4-10]MCG8275401.1 hypothetical protein [Stenotrophomonas sp. NLF4-10]
MAKNSSKTPPAAAGETQPESPAPAAPLPAGDDAPSPAESGADDSDPQPPAPAESGETVPALVLSDNHLGKVGQVVQVPAAHAEQLRLGGLIDPHPNAITYKG